MKFRNPRWAILIAGLGFLPLMTGCSERQAEGMDSSSVSESSAGDAPVCSNGTIDIIGMHLTPAMAGGSGAGYGTIRNSGNAADTLLGIGSDVCSSVEIHEMAESTTGDGMMTMRKLNDPVVLKPGAEFSMKKGGFHLMLIGMKNDLAKGGEATLKLEFANSGTIECNVGVGVPIARRGEGANVAGKTIFKKYCATCHKEDGTGLGRVFPPIDPEFLRDRDRSIDAIVNGLRGEITVKGQKYNGIMSPMPRLYDNEQASAVINYVVETFGDTVWTTTPEEIKEIRK